METMQRALVIRCEGKKGEDEQALPTRHTALSQCWVNVLCSGSGDPNVHSVPSPSACLSAVGRQLPEWRLKWDLNGLPQTPGAGFASCGLAHCTRTPSKVIESYQRTPGMTRVGAFWRGELKCRKFTQIGLPVHFYGFILKSGRPGVAEHGS